MSKIARISITLPQELVVAADRRARQLDRSRSWVVADALRTALSASTTQSPGQVREPAPVYAAAAVAEARQRHLSADLALSLEERVRRAEDLSRLAKLARRLPTGRRQQIIGFDAYEDYYQWKKARLAGA
jgi:hypothetical protein